MPVEIIFIVQVHMDFSGIFTHELSMTENKKLYIRYNKILQYY
jgi:hypothetical protein